MAIDETMTRPKSMILSTRNSTMTEHDKSNVPARLGYLLARKHRIEHWAYKGRSLSISDAAATAASAASGKVSAQKRSESSYSQSGRILNIHLLQLSEQRQKAIEQNNFDQKLFANKQALKYKDNQNILRTLNYVRKCCKYADRNDDEKDNIDPKIFLEENLIAKRNRSRSRSPSATPPPVNRNLSAHARTQTSASMAETFLRHNKKHIDSSLINRKLTESKTTSYTPTITNPSETPVDDDSQKRHVQFRINPDGTQLTSQSAHVISKSNTYNGDKQLIRNITTANGIRTSNLSYNTRPSNSAPLIRTITSTIEPPSNEEIKQTPKPTRSLSRISSANKSLKEFRLHPERFLSPSNRYLPLLRRQALDVESKQQKDKNNPRKRARINLSPPISCLSDGSDLTYDDAKSFLSEEIEIGKHRPNSQQQQQQQPVWLEHERKSNKKLCSSNKIDMMNTIDDEDTSERRLAISRLHVREYARLNQLIRSNSIEQILEPFSAIKTDEQNQINTEKQKNSNYQRQSITSTTNQLPLKPTKIRQLSEILHSIDSLRCSDTVDRRARRQVDIEKNRAKLGILIF